MSTLAATARAFAVAVVLVVPACRSTLSLTDVGLSVPESALHDVAADVYLVSNINGSPFGEDGKGFISRVSPGGEVLELKWIDGAQIGVTLNAPKGMAIVGDTLYVADVTAVRGFDRVSGEPKTSLIIEGTSFLNDVAAGADGTVYVSDTGLGPGFSPTGSDAVYAIRADGNIRVLAEGRELGQPNGLLVAGDRVVVVNWQGGTVSSIAPDGTVTEVARLPENNLDGIVADAYGDWLISSWAGGCVYRVSPGGNAVVALPELDAPADLGIDAKRGRLLLPWFNAARVDILPLP